MKFLFFSILFFLTFKLFAFESEVSLSLEEMKANRIVSVAGGKKDDQLLPVASRIFQLQLNEAGCEDVIVLQSSMTAKEINKFSITSKNCVIKKKKGEMCESGFMAKNIPVNPRTPDDTTLGEDNFKICIKDKKSESSKTPNTNVK